MTLFLHVDIVSDSTVVMPYEIVLSVRSRLTFQST